VPQNARKRAKTSEVGVRDRLLNAADRLFYQEGVRAVGIDRVLSEADAAKASLYSTSAVRTNSWRRTSSANQDAPSEHRGVPRRHTAGTTRAQFRLGVEWAESKDFRGCPLQHTVSELTNAAHPARAIAHESASVVRGAPPEWTTAAGVKDSKATARALMVLFDGAVAGSDFEYLQDGSRCCREGGTGQLHRRNQHPTRLGS